MNVTAASTENADDGASTSVAAPFSDAELLADAKITWSQRDWNIQHVLFPALKSLLKPPRCMANDGTFIKVCLLYLFTSMLYHSERHYPLISLVHHGLAGGAFREFV